MNKVIAVLFILFSPFAYSQEKLTEPVTIPFTVTPDGHIIISAKINGVGGKFIFDTGAGINLLTKEFADKIKGLKKTHHFTTGHRATGEEIRSDIWYSGIEFGDLKIEDEVFTVYDLEFPLAGLISLSPFMDKPLTIDFENKVLIIESGQSLQKKITEDDLEIPIRITNGSGYDLGISTQVTLNDDLVLNVKLDSGAGFDVYTFSSRYMDTLGIDSTKIKSVYRTSPFKPDQGNMYYYSTVDKMSDKNKHLALTDFEAKFVDGLIYEGIMGVNWIGKVFTIDIPNERLLVPRSAITYKTH